MQDTTARLPTYRRVANPPAMRFMARDGRILEAVHAFDGLMGDYQIRRLFFTGERQARGRLALLFQHGYLARPDRRRRASLPCMVYWLDRRGGEYVAGLSGQAVREFRYRREPRWSQIEHDLAVNDFRLVMIQACTKSPLFALEQWLPEGEFWAYPDRVEYPSGNGKQVSRLVRPDGYFVIRRGAYRSRLLLELDRATEDNPRFAREKIRPGLAYLRSKAYKARFGFQSGRWLVVTTGERRMQNLKRQAELAIGTDARIFYFTTYDQIRPDTVLAAPIWHRGGEDHPCPLFRSA